MERNQSPVPIGRGAATNPPVRFRRVQIEADDEYLEHDDEAQAARRTVPTEYFADTARSIVTENDSPDIPFRYNLNPYRGCVHGCSYCFARPTHEYLDLGAGLDFESKIFVKEEAPALFRDFLCRPDWQGETIMISGITDCYQPIERKLEITRRCLAVAKEADQSLALVTKNALVTRDLDHLVPMAERGLTRVAISVTTLDPELARAMEPRTSTPAARLRTISELTAAGVPVHLMVAPIIPGLTDFETPRILEAARQAGARTASYVLLRLPLTVAPVFLEWLKRVYPEKADKVEGLIRQTRDGNLYESGFGVRRRGRGPIAEQIRNTFAVFSRKYGFEQHPQTLNTTRFRRPTTSTGQRWLFD